MTSTSDDALRDRYRGSLLGLATGDALGTTLEFRAPGTFAPIQDMVGGGPFRLIAGQWTDDTSMALCLADSLLKRRGFDPIDQLRRYCWWADDGYMSSNGVCFDIGNTVNQALSRFRFEAQPWCGPTAAHRAGNGSLMRLAPVPMAYAHNPAEALRMARDSSRTTHGAEACLDACRFMAGLIVGALRGDDKATLLSPHYHPDGADAWNTEPLGELIAEVAAGSFLTREPPEIKGTGFVVRSLEAALWAFARTETFKAGALLAVNLGDDADTTGAIYGQLAGAYYGAEGIPKRWRDRVTQSGMIEGTADDLLALSQTLQAG